MYKKDNVKTSLAVFMLVAVGLRSDLELVYWFCMGHSHSLVLPSMVRSDESKRSGGVEEMQTNERKQKK